MFFHHLCMAPPAPAGHPTCQVAHSQSIRLAKIIKIRRNIVLSLQKYAQLTVVVTYIALFICWLQLLCGTSKAIRQILRGWCFACPLEIAEANRAILRINYVCVFWISM